MKRFFNIAAVLAGLLVWIGCDTVDPIPAPVPSAKLLQSDLIPWTGSSGQIVSISATVPITADPPRNGWLTYYGIEMTNRSKSTYALIFEAAANPDKAERNASLDIKSKENGDVLLTITLTQEAAQDPSIKVGEADTFAFTGGEMNILVTSNVPYTVNSSEDWLTATVNEDGVVLTAGPNDDLDDRSAQLAFSYNSKELASLTITQKGRPSEDIILERVWGKYTATDAEWYEQAGLGAADSDRFIAMDDDNVYITRIANSNPGETWGISVFDRKTGAFKTRLADGAGIQKTGLWATSALQVVDNGSGSSMLIACNMSRSAENNILMIYAWQNIDNPPQVISYSYASTHATSRFGDKMGVSGNADKGELYFVDYFATGSNRPMLIFSINNGVISSSPIDTQFGSILTGSSNFATLGLLEGDDYIYYGSSNDEQFYCCTVSREGNDFPDIKLRFLQAIGFDGIMNGFTTLNLSGNNYLLWVTATRSADKVARPSFVKTLQLGGESLMDGLSALQGVSDAQVYPLSGTEMSSAMGRQNGNYTGDMAVRKIGDDWYVAAIGTGSGVSVFKIKVL